MFAISTAVYEASGSPSTAAALRAARPPGTRPWVAWSSHPSPVAGLKPARIQEPTLIGEVILNMRSMCRKRSGLPRSEMSSGGLASAPTSARVDARRASTASPRVSARRATPADAPARPPK